MFPFKYLMLLIYFVIFTLLILIFGTLIRRTKEKKILFYSIALLFQSFWIYAFINEILTPYLKDKMFWDILILIGMYGFFTCFFLFTLVFYGLKFESHKIIYFSIIILSIFIVSPIIIFPNHPYIRSEFDFIPAGDFELLGYTNGIYLWIVLYEALFRTLIICILFLITFLNKKKPKDIRNQAFYMMIGFILSVISILLSSFGENLNLIQNLINLNLFAFSFVSFLTYFAVFHLKIFDFLQIAQELILKSVADGYGIFNENFDILEMNSFFKHLVNEDASTQIFSINSYEEKLKHSLIDDEKIFQLCKNQNSSGCELNIPINKELHIIEAKRLNIFDKNNVLKGFVIILHDITAIKRYEQYLLKSKNELEQKFLQSQKMESLGRLAGGIAHDFNNILTSIIGTTQIALFGDKSLDEIKKSLNEISLASESAIKLTKNLLAFSRKKEPNLSVINFNTLLERMNNIYKPLLREDISLTHHLAKEELLIEIDEGMLEQVIINLIVNSVDAMPNGGNLEITTSKWIKDYDKASEFPDALNKEYVKFTIRDSGVGMSSEILSNLFEPFFTTKPKGQGTGLGLSIVYGVITQNHGYINVESKEKEGTCFTIILPRIGKSTNDSISEFNYQDYLGNGEKVVLVEDNNLIRRTTKNMLIQLGYDVHDYSNGNEILNNMEDVFENMDILFTDVMMPNINGYDLYKLLKIHRPDLKVIFSTGYVNEIIEKHTTNNNNAYLLPKPFNMSQLAKKIHQAIYYNK